MADIGKMIKIDMLSISPYFTLKNLLIIVGVIVLNLVVSNNATVAYLMPFLFAMMFSSYPFLIGEEAGIDGLYRIFGLKEDTIVRGRYIMALILYGLAFLFSMIFIGIFRKITGSFDRTESIVYFIFYTIIFFLVVSITYPIYFNHGYTKARSAVFIPFLIVMAIASMVIILKTYLSAGSKEKILSLISYLASNKVLVGGLIIIFLLLMLTISISLSSKYYRKRDF